MPNKKMGRPKKENPMDKRITIRMDNETYKILEKYCDSKKVDKAVAVRDGIYKLVDDTQNEK